MKIKILNKKIGGRKIFRPLMAICSLYYGFEALPFHWATIVNKGITIRESENSKGVDIKDLAQLRQWVKNDADVLKQQLVDFLYKYRTNYPLWQPEDKCKKEMEFNSGFHFPKR